MAEVYGLLGESMSKYVGATRIATLKGKKGGRGGALKKIHKGFTSPVKAI